MAKKKKAKSKGAKRKKKRKVSPAMLPWLRFSYPCMEEMGLKLKKGKKWTAAQKKRHKACVMKKARAAGLKVAGK